MPDPVPFTPAPAHRRRALAVAAALLLAAGLGAYGFYDGGTAGRGTPIALASLAPLR